MITKRFGGKIYHLVNSDKALGKREANELANEIRMKGSKARVVEASAEFKTSTRKFNNYSVYERK